MKNNNNGLTYTYVICIYICHFSSDYSLNKKSEEKEEEKQGMSQL